MRLNALKKFYTRRCTDELILGNFNGKPIPSDYYNFLNDEDDNDNDILGTPVDNVFPENEGVEDSFMPNDEDIDNKIIINDDDSPALAINPPQNKITEI